MPTSNAPKSKPQPPKSSNEAPQKPIPEHEIKQNSSVSASMALQAMQKAYDLRQAAYGAGDPDAREEILAKAINKEIEAESFGKAAKYTRSGAFQGLAAGAGLGVQPGVTLGKITGALVGGLVASVTGLLGGGIGSVYGAMHGPFWDLGQIASQGVRSIVGDFPNWKSTPAQKRALEKMVMQTKETKAPDKDELERLRADGSGQGTDDSYAKFAKDMTSWMPSMPNMSMPNMPSMPKSMPSMPSWGGGGQANEKTQASQPQEPQQKQAESNAQSKQTQQKSQESSGPKEPSKPKEAPTPKEAPKPQESAKPASSSQRKRPKKLDERSKSSDGKSTSTARKAPRKLESRKAAVAAS